MRKQFSSESAWLHDVSHNVCIHYALKAELFCKFKLQATRCKLSQKTELQRCRNPICSRYLEQLTKQRDNKSQMWYTKSFEVIIFSASTMVSMLGWFLGFLRTLGKGLFTFLHCQIYDQWKSFMSPFSALHAPQLTFFVLFCFCFLFCFMCHVKPRQRTKSICLCSDSDSANRLIKWKVWSIHRLPATDGRGIIRIQGCGLSATLFWPLFKNLYVPVLTEINPLVKTDFASLLVTLMICISPPKVLTLANL